MYFFATFYAKSQVVDPKRTPSRLQQNTKISITFQPQAQFLILSVVR